MLLPGEKKLADQLLKLTKTAREEEATIPEQCKILHKMGELYLKDAIKTCNGEQFVKASALINAALVRTADPSDQLILQELLCNTYRSFLTNIENDISGFSVDSLINKANYNKDDLHAIRVEIDTICEKLKQYFDSESYLDSNDKDYSILVAEDVTQEAEKVSARVQTMMLEYVNRLWRQAAEMCSVSPPCQYAVIGLGSLARQETTPYSDLEFALLIEEFSLEIKEYFKNLVYLFHLHILDLGETPIPTMAIKSLNDFLSPDGDKFFDGITPCGFRLDGAMPWACKTPTGRNETPQREPLDLIKTPEEMAALLREDNDLGQAYHVADILCNSILICGDTELFEQYTALSKEVLSNTSHKKRATRSLIEDCNQSPDWNILYFGNLNLQFKKLFYRLPSSFVENLRIYFTPDYQPNSSWKVLIRLFNQTFLSEQCFLCFRNQLAICYSFRLLTYFKNRAQYENFEFMPTQEIPFKKERIQNPLEARSKCRVAYFQNNEIMGKLFQGNNEIKDVIEKCFIVESTEGVEHLRRECIEFNRNLDFYEFTWKSNNCLFGNLIWARSTKELPSRGCGKVCGIERLSKFTYIPSDDYPALLKGIDEILDIKGCKCLSLIRTSLLVSKANLLRLQNIKTNVPKEANILNLLEIYKERYKNVRERFYFLIDISTLLQSFSDKRVTVAVIDEIETFLGDITTFKESDKKMVNIMKAELFSALTMLYTHAGQSEKSIQQCQELIDIDDRESGLDGVTSSKIALWKLMGFLKLSNGCFTEAFDYYIKAVNVHLNKFKCFTIRKSNMWELDRKHQMKGIRSISLIAAKLFVTHKKIEYAHKLLVATFFKNGESFEIETEEDMQAMCILSPACQRCTVGHRYYEELLEIILEKSDHHSLRPSGVIGFMKVFYNWIVHHWKYKTSYFIGNIYAKHCQGNSEALTKDVFLDKIMCKILDSESLQQYILNRAHSTDHIYFRQDGTEASNESWSFFLFSLCKLSVYRGFEEDVSLPQLAYHRKTFLQQAEIFCEKVVKKIVPKTIHKMCLIYIKFCKIRMSFLYSASTKDPELVQATLELSELVHSDLIQYFPKCYKALKVTNIVETWEHWPRDALKKSLFRCAQQDFVIL